MESIIFAALFGTGALFKTLPTTGKVDEALLLKGSLVFHDLVPFSKVFAEFGDPDLIATSPKVGFRDCGLGLGI